MTTTTNLGLTTYDTASGSATTFLTFRLALAGNSSNMNLIDNFAGETSASILNLRANSLTNVPASQITANYYESTITSISGYTTNMMINLKLNISNTGSVTLNINSLGIITLKKVNVEGTLINLVSSDLRANRFYLFVYNGTYFVLIGAETADQISISGSANNYVSISGSNVLVDSGVAILSGVTTGSFNKVEIDAYGRVTTGSQMGYQTTSSISGSSVMSTTTGSEVRHNYSGVTSASYNKVQVDAFGHITSGSTMGYLTAISGSSVMSNTTGSEVRHNYSGISSGSYTKIIADAFGHITAGSQITGMSASGIEFYTGSVSGSEVNIKNTVVITDGLIISWTQA